VGCPATDANASHSDHRARQRALWKLYPRSRKSKAVESELVEQYLPLARSVVGRLAMTLSTEADIEDLTSSALLGLLMAIRNFDPSNGASFETYARIRIRGAVLDELRRMDWVPRSVHEKARRVESTAQRLEQAKGRAPTDEEMARALKLSVKEYRDLAEEIRPVSFVCLDSVGSTDGEENATPYDSIPDPNQPDPREETERREFIELVMRRLRQLPVSQHRVLVHYYFDDLRLREIAVRFGVTESRVCQVHTQAIHAMRSYLHQLGAACAMG
jgi:RNA polymerase sigma factor for flagellar operon FliA